MEADFIQAELFVLAYLSGDKNMIRNLETPGLDLHTNVTVNSFKMKTLYGPTRKPVIEQEMLDLAARNIKAFEKLQNEFVYVDVRGKEYTYEIFKNGPRIAGKSISFGVPYSRGALDIARQIKAETGDPRPLSEIQAQVEIMINSWKYETNVQAWAYLERCAAAVDSPGYIQNPFGRYRFFTNTKKQEIMDAQKREAQNANIQSTVADAVDIALERLVRYREEKQLHYKLVLQIHDAVMLEVPENEIEQTAAAFEATMGQIPIPMGERTLTLGVDITVLDRWGVKRKQKAA